MLVKGSQTIQILIPMMVILLFAGRSAGDYRFYQRCQAVKTASLGPVETLCIK